MATVHCSGFIFATHFLPRNKMQMHQFFLKLNDPSIYRLWYGHWNLISLDLTLLVSFNSGNNRSFSLVVHIEIFWWNSLLKVWNCQPLFTARDFNILLDTLLISSKRFPHHSSWRIIFRTWKTTWGNLRVY